MKLLAYLEKYDFLERVEQAAADVIHDMRAYKLVINHRAKSRFGCVKYRTSTVEITSEYFINGQIKDGEETDHHNTLLHETAHVIVYHRYGRTVKAHGHEWKRVMHSLGVTPNRVGQSKVLTNANKAAKHVYTCKDCGQEFKKQRQLKNVDRRFHGKCRHNRHGGKLDHYQVR